ncbi:MAG: UDP-glucose/GDP-mannose dehydrogenase family protein [Acidocella sp.]|nr:UDP-glucose/GDP-mannose dehydrogenase family protein [Acidocella sp.]
MRVVIIGGGYVGLVSGTCLAALGADVTVVENNPARFDMLCAGKMPVYEPGLEELSAKMRGTRRLNFVSHVSAAPAADIICIAVGTPARHGDGHADLSHVFAAVEQAAQHLQQPAIFMTKSTVPVGTGRRIAALLAELRPELAVHVASNPEFLREGAAIGDFMRPDRIIIGTDDPHAAGMLARIYAPLIKAGVPLLQTSLEGAELIKYAANGFLAMKIAFVNEMADLCERIGADIAEVARGIGMDTRIGQQFLQAGPGFGGSCFPKDTLALMRIAQDAGAPSRLIETVVSVNDTRKSAMASRVIAACGNAVRGKRIAVLGLTFKANTDDIRESPAMSLVQRLMDEGAHVQVFDPAGMRHARFQLSSGVKFHNSAMDALQGAHAAVFATEWEELSLVTPAQLQSTMAGRVVVDLRNMLEQDAFVRSGFAYHGIGRPSQPLSHDPKSVSISSAQIRLTA